MFTRPELMQLRRQLKSTQTLSVYLSEDTDDPAQRGNGRRALAHRFAHLRDAMRDAAHADREALDRAIAHAEQQVRAIPVTACFKGWVAFVSEMGVQHSAMLPVPVPTEAVWGDGLWLSPYIRGLDYQCSALVVMTDSRMATLWRYRDGVFEVLATLEADVPALSASHLGAPPQQGFHPGTRGRTAADANARVRRVKAARLATEVADQLRMAALPDELILVGGIPAMAHAVASQLLEHEHAQAPVLAGLDIHAGLPEIATRVEVALDTWRLERRRALWHELTESGIVGAHAAFGVTATEAALRLGGVSRLLITEEFERRDPAATEAVVQLACEGDAQITYVGGDTAAHLQKRGAGIAARLRFPIPQPVA
jgi:hypothetical protein